MKLVVGLGNPGATYAHTRHNLGFRVVTCLAQKLQIPLRRSLRFKAKVGRGTVDGEEVVLLLPATYMNRSGQVVGRWLLAEKLFLNQMLVVLDDLQLPLGQLRIRSEGSQGGHQGLWSIIQAVGSGNFTRLRLGIGAPEGTQAWEEYVLEPFRSSEESLVNAMVEEAVDCCRLWVTEGTQSCANQFNVKGGKHGTV